MRTAKQRRIRPTCLFAVDRTAASAVEFALVLPVLLLLVFGAYQASEGVSAYRKVTLTAHTVADLTTQYQTMGTADVATVLNASAQVMVPFNSSALIIVLSEFATDGNGNTTVTWSKSLNGTPLTAGSTVTLPTNVAQKNTSVVLAQVSYSYTPGIANNLTGPLTMSSQIFMNPRSIQSISYTGT